MPQDDLRKTENVFEFSKKPKISNWVSWVVLGAVVLVMAGVFLWSWSGNKGGVVWWDWKTEEPTQDTRTTCQQDSDCVLVPQYQGCCPDTCNNKEEAVNVETKNMDGEARNKQYNCHLKNIVCPSDDCLLSGNKQAVCEQNRCVVKEKQSVNVNANDNITISLNKAYYQKGETVNIIIQNNRTYGIFIPNIAVEKYSVLQNEYGLNPWGVVKYNTESLCGDFSRERKDFISISSNERKDFYWRQEIGEILEKLDEKTNLPTCKKAGLGKYRIKIDYYEYDGYDGKVGINKASETIYSNEFEILEKAKNAALLTTDKKEYNRDEDVKIIIRNSLNKAIWFNSTLTTTKYKISTLSIERFYDRRWEKIAGFYSGLFLSLNKWLDQHAQKLEPAKEFILNWNQNIDENKDKTGSYRIKLDYYTFDENFSRILTPDGSETVPIIKNGRETWEKRKGWKEAEAEGYKQTIYSNEFIIKESKASYRQCQTDNDCVIVSPLCGNSLCAPQDKECLMNCSNVLSINKNFQDLWQRTKAYIEGNQIGIKCLPSGIRCELMSLPSFYDAICKNNLCEAILRR